MEGQVFKLDFVVDGWFGHLSFVDLIGGEGGKRANGKSSGGRFATLRIAEEN